MLLGCQKDSCLMWLWKAQRGAARLMVKQLLHSNLYRCVAGPECQSEEGGRGA